MVAFFEVAWSDGDDFDAVVETLPKGYGYTVGGAVLVGEDIAVVATGEFEDTLVRNDNGVDLTKRQCGADEHAGADFFTAIGDVEFGLESMAGGVDGGVNNLDSGGEGLVGVDVAMDVDFHALFDEGIVCFRDVDDGFEATDLGEGEDRCTSVHLAVFIVLGTDDAGELSTDKGIFVLEAFGFDELVVAGLGLIVDLFADTTGGLEGSDTVEFGFGAVEVDAGGVELGLVHAYEHGTFLDTATHLDVDVFDVSGDAR